MTQQISVTMNDRDFDLVARNVVLLLLVLTADESTDIQTKMPFGLAEALIHLWYSALIPFSMLSYLKTKVAPMIAEVCNRIINNRQTQFWPRRGNFRLAKPFVSF